MYFMPEALQSLDLSSGKMSTVTTPEKTGAAIRCF
jgi:hypothetical protein